MLPVATAKDLYILQAVLAVVALARRVRHVLRPDERGIAILADLDLNLLALVALNHELGAFE